MSSAKAATAGFLYKYFIDCLKTSELSIKTGFFGEEMKVRSELDGPVY